MRDYNFAKKFKCIKCGSEYKIEPNIYNCPKCKGNLDIEYEYDAISRVLSKEVLRKRDDFSIFRYKEFFPAKFDIEKYNKLNIGWTPLYRSEILGEVIGYKNFYIKDDTKNPSASFKDRASIMAIIDAIESGKDLIIGASTGNAASSLACLSASLGIKNLIFIPQTAPKAKVAQLLIFGANLVMVKGNYDNAFELSLKVTGKYGFYNRNTGFNPFTREGKKTVSYEIVEQLNWEVPDYVFVPVGDGNIISGVWKGFKDLYNANLITNLPKIIGVQSELSSAVSDAIIERREIKAVKATTIADSISVDFPRDGDAAVKAIVESNGFPIKVKDEDILKAQSLLAKYRGIFAEPAGATSLAGLIKALNNNLIEKSKISVILVTGSGLKDIDSVLKNLKEPEKIEPSIEEFDKIKGNFLK